MHLMRLCSQYLIIVALYGTQPYAMKLTVLKMYKKAYTRRVFRKFMKPYANYENRLAYMNRKTIETRRYIMSLTMFSNILYKHVTCNILDSFTAPAHNRNMRGHYYKILYLL